jgi:Mg2+ and Co2+ transporter CorA
LYRIRAVRHHDLDAPVQLAAARVLVAADRKLLAIAARHAQGFINIEQNQIIKIFSVAAVAFLPPTLVASIYGMNFHVMPELSWTFGYPIAIVVMVASAVLPYAYFKRRGWL